MKRRLQMQQMQQFNKTFAKIFEISAQSTEEEEKKATMNKQKFFRILGSLEYIKFKNDNLALLGVDLSGFEEEIMHIIYSILLDSLSKKDIILIHNYLYGEVLPMENEDESLDVEINSPEELWELISKNKK